MSTFNVKKLNVYPHSHSGKWIIYILACLFVQEINQLPGFFFNKSEDYFCPGGFWTKSELAKEVLAEIPDQVG